jgi:hypothetical protein
VGTWMMLLELFNESTSLWVERYESNLILPPFLSFLTLSHFSPQQQLLQSCLLLPDDYSTLLHSRPLPQLLSLFSHSASPASRRPSSFTASTAAGGATSCGRRRTKYCQAPSESVSHHGWLSSVFFLVFSSIFCCPPIYSLLRPLSGAHAA